MTLTPSASRGDRRLPQGGRGVAAWGEVELVTPPRYGADTCPLCGGDMGDTWFDRSLCPEPCGSMHTRAECCGWAFGMCPFEWRGAA